jgi:hypothetical protein
MDPGTVLVTRLRENGIAALDLLAEIKDIDSKLRSSSWLRSVPLFLRRAKRIGELHELLQRRDELWDGVVPIPIHRGPPPI